MIREIHNLREISRLCLGREPLSEDLAQWLGQSLDDFLTRRCRTLYEAFELRSDRGGVPWYTEEAMRVRDAALRGLAELHFPHLSISAQSKQIATMCLRYAGSAWRFDCEREQMPPGYRNAAKEFVWCAFKSRAVMPVGERQLRNILAR